MNNTATLAARLADLHRRGAATDAAASAALQQLLHQGRHLADAMQQLADAMDADPC